MGVSEFGYWQLFIFYTSYVYLFHLGLNDGVYLFNGGLSRKKVNKASINTQFVIGMLYQVFFSTVLVIGAFCIHLERERVFVLIMTGIYLLVNNGAAFIGYLLQAMDETKKYSLYCAVNGLLFLTPLVGLLVFHVSSFEYYVIFYVIAHVLSFCLCLWWVKDFVPFGFESLRLGLKDTKRSISAGIKVMFASIAGTIILGVPRFFVDAMWDIETFGMVSFALSMVSFFLVFTQQASMVLFPALRKVTKDGSVRFFQLSRDAMNLILPIIYLLFFLAIILVEWWLPDYKPSIIYFAFLLPVAIFHGRQSVVGNTFLLVLRREGVLFKSNIIAALISVIGAFVGAFVFHSVIVMILFADLAIMWRSIYVEKLLEKELSVPSSWTTISVILISISFLFAYQLCYTYVAFLITAIFYLSYLLVSRKTLRKVMNQMKAAF